MENINIEDFDLVKVFEEYNEASMLLADAQREYNNLTFNIAKAKNALQSNLVSPVSYQVAYEAYDSALKEFDLEQLYVPHVESIGDYKTSLSN